MKTLGVAVAIAGAALVGSLSVAARAQAPTPAATAPGAALFNEHCATCHDGAPDSRAPAPSSFAGRAPEQIIEALVNGAMRTQGSRLSGEERHALAEYLTGKAFGGDPTGAATGRCKSPAPFTVPDGSPAWNGWSPSPTNTRFQPEAAAGLSAAQVPRLTLKWAFGFPDASSAWAQPAIVGGRVFVGSQNGTVYSLDGATGCIVWYYSAGGGVRTAMTVGPKPGGGFAVYFGDTSASAIALDASTGKELWRRRVEDHPLARITGSPTLYNGRLYVPTASYEESQGASPDYGCCTFRGSVTALDAGTGDVVWKTYTVTEAPKPRGTSTTGVTLYGPSGSAIWSAPTIDAKRRLVYVSTGNTYSGPPQPSSDAVVALDLDSGAIKWTKQVTPGDIFLSGCGRGRGNNPNCQDPNGPDFDFGNSPVLATLPDGKDAIVIGQKSGVGYAMDPDRQGAVLWQYRAGRGGALGGIEWGSAVDSQHAYFPLSDIFTPNPGGLHAVDLATGERAWMTPPPPAVCGRGFGCSGAQSAAITVIPGIVFSGSVDGALRAYSADDGHIVWTFDTNRDFTTANGVPAHGGSMIGPGPAVAGGLIVVSAGYGAFGGHAGNALLAFGVS
jgi:polyvinyl alcohol dehydrogenase (cytochrome)